MFVANGGHTTSAPSGNGTANQAAQQAAAATKMLQRFHAISGYNITFSTVMDQQKSSKSNWLSEVHIPNICPTLQCGVRARVFSERHANKKGAETAAVLSAVDYLLESGLAPFDLQSFNVVRKQQYYTTDTGITHVRAFVIWQLLKHHPQPVHVSTLRMHPDTCTATPSAADQVLIPVLQQHILGQGLVHCVSEEEGGKPALIALSPRSAGFLSINPPQAGASIEPQQQQQQLSKKQKKQLQQQQQQQSAKSARLSNDSQQGGQLGGAGAAARQQQQQGAWEQVRAQLLQLLEAAFPFAVEQQHIVAQQAGDPDMVEQALLELAVEQRVELELSQGEGREEGTCWRWCCPTLQQAREATMGVLAA